MKFKFLQQAAVPCDTSGSGPGIGSGIRPATAGGTGIQAQ